MSATAILTYFNNKKTLFAAAIIFIFPFILFSFWNVPSTDDYMIIAKKNQFSFWQLQSNIYHNWTGRYFATFVSGLFSYSGFLYSHYYLHSILLLLLTIFSWLFCLNQINNHLLNNKFTFSSLAFFSMFLLIAEINIIPENVTAFYWFSSAVTYQLPLIILIFLAGIIINSLFNFQVKIIRFIVASLLIIMLNGCNEIITLFVLIHTGCVLSYFLFTHKKIPRYILSLFLINIISAGFLFFSPGIANRSSLLGHGSLLSAAGIAFIKFFILNWFFLKEPLWWFLLLFTVIFFISNKDVLRKKFKNIAKPSAALLLMFYAVSILLTYIPVLYITNGSIPLRAENIICFLNSLLLLFIIAVISGNSNISAASFSTVYKNRFLLFSLAVFCTANMKNVTDSLLSGYFYSKIMNERLDLFKSAKQQNLYNITIDDYGTVINKKLTGFPFANRQIIKDIITKPPPIICFKNDLYDMNYIKQFYGIKNLYIRK